jgi:hypothetical protein
MSVRVVAHTLGISKSQAARLLASGMQQGTREQMEEWRRLNAKPRNIKRKPLPNLGAMPAGTTINQQEEPEDPDATKQAVEIAERPEEIVIGERSCQETLKALRSSRQYCQSRIAACHKRGDEAMARQWVQTLNNIVSRQAAMEDRLRDILERDGKTMSIEAAERTYRQVFTDLRQKLLAAPAALAAQLNPNDPIHAQGIMENWVRLLFKETHETNRQEN